MVYTRIVQPGIRKKYHYVPGERTLFRVEGTIIPKVWKTAVLVALLTLALCFARPGVVRQVLLFQRRCRSTTSCTTASGTRPRRCRRASGSRSTSSATRRRSSRTSRASSRSSSAFSTPSSSRAGGG